MKNVVEYCINRELLNIFCVMSKLAFVFNKLICVNQIKLQFRKLFL